MNRNYNIGIYSINKFNVCLICNVFKNEKNNSATTRARKVVAIRQFFKYLTDNKLVLDYNPMKALNTPKTKNSQKSAQKF